MPSPENHLFFTRLDTWCEWLAHNHGRSRNTVSKYRQLLMRYQAWVLHPPKDPKLAPATTTDPLHTTLADLERFTGLYAHHLKMTPRARRPMVSAIRGFFAWLSSNNFIANNPAAALPLPKAGRPLPKAMQLRDAEKLLMQPDITSFTGIRDACVLMLFMGCGFRLSGVCALNESSLVWFEDNGREHLAIRVVEKGERERLQPVPIEAAMLLRAYLGHPDLASIPRDLLDGDRVLFVSERNRTLPASDYYGEKRRLHPRSVQDMITDRCAAAGVPKDVAHPHALRHLFGAELAEEDTSLLTHQVLMGHSDPSSTKIYAHLAVRKLRQQVERANPLGKLRGPLLDSLRSLDRAVTKGQGAPIRPRRRVET